MIVSLKTKFRGHAGHYAELTGPFTDKRGHWSKKFVSDEPFELILSYEIVVTSLVTSAEFSVCHKDDLLILCSAVTVIYNWDVLRRMRQTSQRGPKGYACPHADAIVGANQPTYPFSSLTLLYPYDSKELFLEERNGNRNVNFCAEFADMKIFSYL